MQDISEQVRRLAERVKQLEDYVATVEEAKVRALEQRTREGLWLAEMEKCAPSARQ